MTYSIKVKGEKDMFYFLIYGLGAELLILLLIGIMAMIGIAPIIWLLSMSKSRNGQSDRISALESRVERLERQIDSQYEKLSQKFK
jgi:hypothetical protein